MTIEEQAAYSQIQPQIENIVKSYMVSSVLVTYKEYAEK